MSQNTHEIEKSLETPRQLAQAELAKFVDNPGLDKLAELFGAAELPDDSHERLLALQGIAAEHWDFRNGSERQAVNWSDSLLDQEGSEQWRIVFEVAESLGMVQNSEPSIEVPDLLVALGGANRAPIDRIRYGLEKVTDFGKLVYLGSAREISDAEKANVSDYAPQAKTEFDLGHFALENFLGAEAVGWHLVLSGGVDHEIWQYNLNHNDKTVHAFSMSTPQKIGERRANTYDNYDFLTDQPDLFDTGKTVVAATNALYRQGQHLAAVQELTLKYGTKVQTIGFGFDYNGVVIKSRQLLQETKSAIDAAVRLELALNPVN